MVVRCLRCKARLVVAEEQAAKPGLKLRCPSCALVFPLARAPRALEVTAAAAGPAVGVHTPPDEAPRPATGPGGERTAWACAGHATVAAVAVCLACEAGWCRECARRVQTALLCPRCGGLTVAPFLVERDREERASKALPLWRQLPDAALYPFTNPIAFACALAATLGLTLAVWIPSPLLSGLFGTVRAALLVATSVMAIQQVGAGKPGFEFKNVESRHALLDTLFLGAAVILVSDGPSFLWWLYAEGQPGYRTGYILAGSWSVLYRPIAMTAAAVTQSPLEVLKPHLGVGAIVRMGLVYWQAAGVCVAAGLAQFLGGFLLFGGPLAALAFGSFRRAVDLFLLLAAGYVALEVYLAFALGAVLGFALDKRAEVLDLE